MGTLLCCGQLAMVVLPGDKGRDTKSLLSADYHPWPYDKIPPINVEAFMRDIGTEEAVVFGDFWVPPLPAETAIAQVTGTPIPSTQIATNTPDSSTIKTLTPTSNVTIIQPPPTSTLQPSSTPLPSITNTLAPI